MIYRTMPLYQAAVNNRNQANLQDQVKKIINLAGEKLSILTLN